MVYVQDTVIQTLWMLLDLLSGSSVFTLFEILATSRVFGS